MPDFTETLVRKNEVYRGKSINFRVDTIRLPNGKTAQREFIDHPGAVAVVPLLPGGKVVLVRQYRYPVAETTYEIPAGKLDKGEERLACVRRELQEETGYTAKRVVHLLNYWPTPAFANELIDIYVARGLTKGKTNPDDDEFVEPKIVPMSKALGWIRSGKIRDSKTCIALLACRVRRIA